MHGNEFVHDAPSPMPPSQASPHWPPPQGPRGPTNQPQLIPQQPATPAPANATDGKPRRRSKLLWVLLAVAVVPIALVVIVAVAAVVASSAGLIGSDQVDDIATPQLDPPSASVETNEEDDGSEGATAAVPITREGVTITWDASPSACDGNNKRSFSATIGNATSGALEVRVRILDSANNFVHQSHVYTVPASDQAQVDLGGIPSGQSTVQIVDETNGEAIDQTGVAFENC